MKRLTDEDILEINSKIADSWNEGVFVEPFGISKNEKGIVVYQRHETGGSSGGNCWGNYSIRYNGEERPDWEALDLVLKKISPNISYLQYKDIKEMEIDSDDTDYEYYGNYTDYTFYWIPLEEIYKYLGI